MTVIAYAAMLCLTVGLAAALDEIWLRYVRPLLSAQYGWPDVQPDERIPAAWWAGAAVVLSIMFIFLPFVGVSAGY